MSSSPLSQSSHHTHHTSDSKLESHSASSSSGAGSLSLPATKAVNNLIKKQNSKKDDLSIPHDGLFSMRWPRLDDSVSSDFQAELKDSDTDLSQFPAIEWSLSDDDDEEDLNNHDITMDSSNQTSVSAPAGLGCRDHHHHAPRRGGSLVRSISLVSSIMKEMNTTTGHVKKNRKSPSSSLKAHKKQRHPKTKTALPKRLVPLSHPVALVGLEVGHHTGTGKYFL